MSDAGPASAPVACSGEEVGGGAEHGAHLGDAGVLRRLGDAEVGELDRARVGRHEEVAGLHVAVDDARRCASSSPSTRGHVGDGLLDATCLRLPDQIPHVGPSTYSMTM